MAEAERICALLIASGWVRRNDIRDLEDPQIRTEDKRLQRLLRLAARIRNLRRHCARYTNQSGLEPGRLRSSNSSLGSPCASTANSRRHSRCAYHANFPFTSATGGTGAIF